MNKGGWVVGVAVAACGAQGTLAPLAPLSTPVAASASASEGTVEPAVCAGARALYEKATNAKHAPSRPCRIELASCALALLAAHPDRCEELAMQARGTAAAARRELLDQRGSVEASRDGRWLLEGLSTDGDRLWEMTTEGPRLAWRLERRADNRFEDGRLLALRSARNSLEIIELEDRKLHRMEGVASWAREGKDLLVVEAHRVLKLDWATLAPRGLVSSLEGFETSGRPRLLRGGKFVLVGNQVGAFDTGKVLVTGEVRATSQDERRVLLCQENTLVDYDLETRTARGRFPTDGTPCQLAAPTYAAQERLVLWFSLDPDNQMVVRTLDLATGKQTEFLDTKHSFAGLSLTASIDNRSGRLCLTLVGKGWQRQECDWLLRGKRVSPSPRPSPPAAPLRPLPGPSREEFSRATSPDGTRLAVLSATFDRHAAETEMPLSDLRLRVFDAKTLAQIQDDVRLRPEAFVREWSFLGTPPEVSFLTPARVLVYGGFPSSLGSTIYDLSTRTVSVLEGDEVKGGGSGPIVVLGPGQVLDARTMRTFTLAADEASFEAARRLADACP